MNISYSFLLSIAKYNMSLSILIWKIKMTLNLMLKEEQYQTTIYLNDRPYDVFDTGEGQCSIIIVNNIGSHIEQLTKARVKNRVILVDITKMLEKYIDKKEVISQLLANDLHLLFDVFWLEDVQIKSEVKHVDMTAVFDVVALRKYSRSLLKSNF
ncbi:hypothetical protein VSU01S_21370 [Vibrio superstes NBRC 103154]|uniref:Uncharacterized protein n=2 Tax=Vibrio superstes TaxID=198815 RepID=A0A511QTL0_9VIBR|nr:hypothetical protein VSU01S_21370 [Vibrio superstes NBRC 103154]